MPAAVFLSKSGTFRGSLRAAAKAILLVADTIAGSNIYLPRDWPLNSNAMPAISLQTPRWRHVDRTNGLGAPQFWSTVHLSVHCQLDGTGDEAGAADLENRLDILADQVETALGALIIGPPQLFRRLAEVNAELGIDASGERHVGTVDLTFALEYSTGLEALIADRLDRMVIAVDLKRPFDGAGAYPPYAEPAFNDEVSPAPRVEGPDGRPEAVIDIAFP